MFPIGIAAIVAFLVAVLMHAFGWSSGKVDVELVTLLGFLFLAIHLVYPWPWRR